MTRTKARRAKRKKPKEDPSPAQLRQLKRKTNRRVALLDECELIEQPDPEECH